MSACSKLTYSNVTPAAWQQGVQFAAKHNVAIASNQGEATASKFTIAWNYDPSEGIITLQCTDSPIFVPCSIINAFIDRTVKDCMEKAGTSTPTV